MYQKVKDINSNHNSNLNALPEEIKIYFKDQEVGQKIKKEEEENKVLRQKERQLLERIKKNGNYRFIKCVKCVINLLIDVTKRLLEKQLDHQKSKFFILQSLSDRLDDEIKTEEEIAAKIEKDNETINSNNAEEETNKRIQDTIKELNEFSSRGISTSAAKEKCMSEIEKHLMPVPSTMIFDVLLKSLQSKAEDPFFFTSHTTKSSNTIAEQLLEEFKEMKINLGFEITSLNVKMQTSKQLCASIIEQVENDLDEHEQTLMNSMYDDDEDDDIVGELVAALVGKLVVEGKYLFVKQRIEEIRSKNAREESIDIEEITTNIQDTNQMIVDKIASIQSDFAKIHQINERYKLANMKIMRAVNNFKVEKHQQTNRALLSQTMNNTILDKSTSIETGLDEEELDLFLSMPMKGEEKYDEELETLLVSSPVTQLFSQNIVTFTKTLKSLKMLVMQMQESNIELSPSIDVASVIDEEFIKQVGIILNENSKEITLMLDNIAKRNVNLKSLLRNVELIYKFIIENPLKKFIDPHLKYENKTFVEYENEYMLYYKMINTNVK